MFMTWLLEGKPFKPPRGGKRPSVSLQGHNDLFQREWINFHLSKVTGRMRPSLCLSWPLSWWMPTLMVTVVTHKRKTESMS